MTSRNARHEVLLFHQCKLLSIFLVYCIYTAIRQDLVVVVVVVVLLFYVHSKHLRSCQDRQLT